MELKDFIKDVLEQMDSLKDVQQKKNYLVDELEFELALSIGKGTDKKIEVSASAFGIGAGGNRVTNSSIENIQKVKIKLTPRNQQ